MAAKQRAAAKALAKVEETLHRVHEPLDNVDDEPQKRGPGRLSQAVERLEQVAQDVDAARQEHQRVAGRRETVMQSIRAIGHAYHFVDLERGVRRNGKLIAGDIQRHIGTIRTIAQHEHLSETCLERIEKAERVVPNAGHHRVCLGVCAPAGASDGLGAAMSYAMHAQLIPAFYLDRVASTPGSHRRRAAAGAGGARALRSLSPVGH